MAVDDGLLVSVLAVAVFFFGARIWTFEMCNDFLRMDGKSEKKMWIDNGD